MDVFRTAPDLLAVVGLDGRILHANEAWMDQLEWDPHELEGRSLLDLVHPTDRDAATLRLATLRDGHDVGSNVSTLLDKRQREHIREWSATVDRERGVGFWSARRAPAAPAQSQLDAL